VTPILKQSATGEVRRGGDLEIRIQVAVRLSAALVLALVSVLVLSGRGLVEVGVCSGHSRGRNAEGDVVGRAREYMGAFVVSW